MADFNFVSGLSTDLIGPTSSPTGFSMGLYNPYTNYYSTNYLGGITMPPPLMRDMYSSPKIERARNIRGFTQVLTGLGLFLGGCLIFRKFGKLFKNIGKTLQGIFKKTPTPSPAPTP